MIFKKNYFSFLISHFSFPQGGFTLIELMVVISIAAVLGVLGIAGFNNYNKVQILQNAANDLVVTLNLAKSRALSQVNAGNCLSLVSSGYSLDGYKVEIRSATNSYGLMVSCSNGGVNSSDEIYEKILPASISFDASTFPLSYFFPVLKGGVTAGGQIVLKNSDNNQKSIMVNSLGGVSVQ